MFSPLEMRHLTALSDQKDFQPWASSHYVYINPEKEIWTAFDLVVLICKSKLKISTAITFRIDQSTERERRSLWYSANLVEKLVVLLNVLKAAFLNRAK